METSASRTIVSAAQRLLLERWVAVHYTPQSVTMRARIVLLTAAGESNSEIARRPSVSRPTVVMWRERFAAGRPEALSEVQPGRGRKPTISAAKVKAIAAATPTVPSARRTGAVARWPKLKA